MINKNSKGKEHIRRPLPVRAIAILMAFAMVLSVLYINNRRSAVEAGTPTTGTFTDTTYLGETNTSGIGTVFNYSAVDPDTNQPYTNFETINAVETQTYNVYVPSTGVSFSSFKNINALDPFNITLSKVTNTSTNEEKYYITAPSNLDDTTYSVGAVDASVVMKPTWSSASINAAADPGNQLLLQTKYTVTVEGTAISVEDIDSKEKNLLAINFILESFSDVSFVDGVVSDANLSNRGSSTNPATTLYYGTLSLEAKIGDATEFSSVSGFDDINNSISSLNENEKYKAEIKKEITVRKTWGDTSDADYNKDIVVASVTTDINYAKNTQLLSGVWYQIDGDEGPTALTLNSESGEYETPLLPPNKKIIVGFTTDIEFDDSFTGINCNPLVTLNKDTNDKKKIYCEIPAAADTNAGTSASYEVTIDDASYFPTGCSQSTSFKVNVKFDTGKPEISSITVDQKAISGDKYYVNTAPDDSGKGSATVAAIASISNTSAGKISSYTYNSTTVDLTTDQQASPFGISFSASELVRGANTVTLSATSSYGITSEVSTLNIYYDPDQPTVTPVIKQGSTVVAGEVKATSTKDTSVSFTLADGENGSGIDTFVVKDAAGTVVNGENATSFTIPANPKIDDSNPGNNGATLTYNYTATDKAGNTTTGSFNVVFYNEDATITYSINKEDYLSKPASEKIHGIIWAPADLTASPRTFQVTFLIDSDAPIATAEFDGQTINNPTKNSDGKYVAAFTINASTDVKENWTLTATNVNGVPHECVITKVYVDITDSTFNCNTTSSLAPEAVDDWYKDVVLVLSATDSDSGLSSVTSVGVNTDNNSNGADNLELFNGTPGTTSEWTRTVYVNESASNSGTDIRFTIKDRAGNTVIYPITTDPALNYKVDKTLPTAAIRVNGESVSGNVYVTSEPTVYFDANDAFLNETNTLVYVGDATTGITRAEANSKSLHELFGDSEMIENKKYALKVVAYDKAGNNTTVSTTIVLDNTPPVLSINTVTSEDKTPGYFKQSTVVVGLEINDKNIKSATVKVDNDEVTPSWTKETDKWTAQINVSGEGKHTVSMSATDMCDTTRSATDKTFTIDTSNPDITTYLNDEKYSETNSFNKTSTSKVEYSDATPDDNDVRVEVTHTTPQGVASASTKTGKGPHTFSSDGYYFVKYVVRDLAGNEAAKTIGFTVDNTAPVHNMYVKTSSAKTDKFNNTYENKVGRFGDEKESYKYGKYFNTSVAIDLSIFDYNHQAVTVTDNGEEVEVEWNYDNSPYITGSIEVSEEGEHTIVMTSSDKSGNSTTDDADTKSIHFTIDYTNPVLTTYLNEEKYDADNSYLTSKPKVTLSVADTNDDSDDVTITVKKTSPIGEVTTTTTTGNSPVEVSDDGVYKVDYTVVDRAGNKSTKSVGFTLDNGIPVHNMYVKTSAAKIDKYSNNYENKVGRFDDYSNQEAYTYGQYFNTDVSIDVAYFDYNMDSVTVYDNDVPVDVEWSTNDGYGKGTVTISSEGYHLIRMSSQDKSGNKVSDSGDATVKFTIDKTDPVLTTYLNGDEYVAATAYVYKAVGQVGVEDINDDPEDVSITAIRSIPGDGSDTSTYYGQTGVEYTADGYYTVTYVSTDKAGNSANATYGFTVDTTSPVHNMYVLAENPSKFSSYKNNYNNPVGVFATRPSQESYEYGQYYNYDVNVELNVFDYNLDWVYVSDNGNELSPNWTWDGAYGKATITIQSEGYHEIKMWSKDLSGNETDDTEAVKKIRFYIDKTGPSITTILNGTTYTEGSGVRYLNSTGSLSVSVNDTNKDSTDLVRTSKTTPPGGSATVATDNIGETTETYQTEADYEVQYVATDLAGNKSATRNVQFRVDKTPPQLSISEGGGTSTATSFAIAFGVKEAFYWDMTSCKYSIYKKRDGVGESLEKSADFTPRSANDSTSYTVTEDAEYRMEFSAEDKCGNKTETKGTLIKDGTAPIILLSGVSNYDKTDKEVTLNISVDEAFYTTNKVTLTGTRTDINGKTTNLEFNQFTTNRAKLSQLEQLFKEDGIYDITIVSTDKAGNSSSKSIHFTIDTTDPVIGDLSKYDGVKLNSFKWDVDLDALVTDLTVCDISVYMDGSLYDGTSDIPDGSHVLKVEAIDELGHKSFKEVTFVLDTKAPNIIISNVEDGDNLLESTDITVTVEIDEDVLDTVALNDKSVSVSGNKATFTVNEKGNYRINATAHDEAGNVTSTEIQFTFGKQANLKIIAIIAGAAILLLLLLLLLLKRRRDNN